MSNLKVAFIGLGVMGYPMAGHLARAGYETRVYNRTSAKAARADPARGCRGRGFRFHVRRQRRRFAFRGLR